MNKTFWILPGLCLTPFAQAELTHIDSAELQTLLEQGTAIIDIRTPSEWKKTGIVEGSHLMTFFDENGQYNPENWLAELGKVAKPQDPVILICATGGRTFVVGQFLDRQAGYQQVYNVNRGIMRWIKEGHPVVTVEQAAKPASASEASPATE